MARSDSSNTSIRERPLFLAWNMATSACCRMSWADWRPRMTKATPTLQVTTTFRPVESWTGVGQQPRVLGGQADGHLHVADVAAQHHELVAGEPADHVAAPDGRLEPLGQSQEHLVAAGVPERVVDQLEPVEVDEQDGQVGAALHRHQQLPLELVVEEGPVAQPGQRVVVGQPVELGLGRLPVGHVGERADHHGGLVLARAGQQARAERQPLATAAPVGDADDHVVLGLAGGRV